MAWSTRPSRNAGQRIRFAAEDAIGDQIEYLSSRECSLAADTGGVSNSTTPVATNLSRAVNASTKYHGRALFYYSAHQNGDFKPSLSLPSGTTFHRYWLFSQPASNSTNSGDGYWGTETTLGNLSAPGMATAADIVACMMFAMFTVGGNAGNAVITYAQASATSSAATFIRAHSTWNVWEVDSV